MSATTFDATLTEALSIPELENRRETLIAALRAKGGETDLSVASDDELKELAFITRALRRKNAGPPRTAKPVGGKKKSDKGQDLLNIL